MERNEPVQIKVVIREDLKKNKYLLVWDLKTRKDNGDEARIYMPRSQVIAREDQPNGTSILKIPYWLAENEGLCDAA